MAVAFILESSRNHMKLRRRFLIFFFLSWFGAAGFAQEARIAIDSLQIESGRLVIDFHVDSLLTNRLISGMQRGITSSARFRVQLWRKSGWLFNALAAEREFQVKSTFEPWESKFFVQSAGERRLTKSLDFVRSSWERHRRLVVADSSQLSAKARYYIVIEIVLEPVSRESLQEIRGWLSGEVKGMRSQDSTDTGPPPPVSGLRSRVFDTVVDLTGFGAHVMSVKSKQFQIDPSGRIDFAPP